MTIGQRLRLAIGRAGLTQKEIARRAGLQEATVSDVLNDRIRPSFATVERMVVAIGATFGRIFDEPRVSLSAEDAMLIRDFRDLPDRLLAADAPVTAATAPPVRKRTPRRRAVKVAAATADSHEVQNLPAEPIPERYYRMGARRAFAVVTDSMIGDGIVDGSVIYVRPAADIEAADGEIIVCTLNGTRYLKRLSLRGRRRVLESASPRYPALVVTRGDELALIGVVVR